MKGPDPRPSGPSDLRGQVALVTGGARDAERTIREAGRRALGLSLDVTDPQAVRRTVGHVAATLGRLDILVIALTRWVANDVGQSGIYVNSVAPGGVETAMTAGFAYPVDGLPVPRMGTPEDVAEAVLFLASPASNYVTGQVLRVDGGWVIG